MPYFSIVIPCFNAAATLPATLASLKAQTDTDWEAICVDDGSTDETRRILREAAADDRRIHMARNTGKGPSMARNLGAIALAKGKIIAFCDADDLWVRDKLAQLRVAFGQDDVDGVFGQVGFFRDTPAEASVFSTVPKDALSIDMLLGENPVCTMSNLAVRSHVVVESGGFDTELVHNEDLEWLIRLVGKGARLIGVDALQTWYRTSEDGLSADFPAMLAGRERALATAQRFGVTPSRASHAVHHRYLARRALRLAHGRTTPLRHALSGIAHSPSGFMTPLHRGGLTLAGSLAATVLPQDLSRKLFSR